jgi:phosphatidylglycerophosphate synthase
LSVRSRLLAAGALGCLLALVIGFTAHSSLPLSPRFPWTATLLVAVLTIGAWLVPDAHPFDRLGAANHVTFVRAVLVALLGAAVFDRTAASIAGAAVVIAAAVAVLDGVDGWLARRARISSAFGARIDMELDALFILILSLLVWRHGKAGVWVLAGGLMRYAFAAAGWLLPWLAAPLTPTQRGRTMTIVHVVGLCVALAPIIPWPLSAMAAGVTNALLAWSFAVDVGRLWRGEGSGPVRPS